LDVVIHAADIGWHRDGARRFSDGLRRLGVKHRITAERQRIGEGLAILLGTTMWKAVENGPYLLVDRASFRDPQFVSLVRDGHGRLGDHRVPENPCPSRWERYAVPLQPWQSGKRVVLCGQHESWSRSWSLADWYAAVAPHATHFRKHPRGEGYVLPPCDNWKGVGRAITLNSSVAVDAVIAGVPTVTMDAAAMAWDVTAHDPRETTKPPRLPWLHRLAWTQWNWDEISEGKWAHLL